MSLKANARRHPEALRACHFVARSILLRRAGHVADLATRFAPRGPEGTLRCPPGLPGKTSGQEVACSTLMPKEGARMTMAITMTPITLQMPDDVFAALRRSPDEFARELRLAAAVHWYSRGDISQEKAAEIAGLNRKEFLLALAREKVDVFLVDFDDLKRELALG